MVLPLNKTLGTFETPLTSTQSISTDHSSSQHGISNSPVEITNQPLHGQPSSNSPLAFSAIVKSSISQPRSEISLFFPNQAPPTFQAGTFPHSVFYTLPAQQLHLQLPFLQAIRQHFPRGVGLGLNTTQATPSADITFELAL